MNKELASVVSSVLKEGDVLVAKSNEDYVATQKLLRDEGVKVRSTSTPYHMVVEEVVDEK